MAMSTRHSSSLNSTMSGVIMAAGTSALSPGSIVLRRTWPTPSAKMPLGCMMMYSSAPKQTLQGIAMLLDFLRPRGTFTVVQSL